MTPAVFLDRDGTLIHDMGYLSRFEDLRWYPFAIDAVRLLNRAGFLVFVVTNQGGIGRGFYPEAFVLETHAVMDRTLRDGGARVDGWFYCPHHPRAIAPALREPCACRKPGRGMADQAAARFAIDWSRSVVVGDKHTDVAMAAAIGGRGVLVLTGHGAAELARTGGTMPDAAAVVSDLMEATSWILRA